MQQYFINFFSVLQIKIYYKFRFHSNLVNYRISQLSVNNDYYFLIYIK